MQTNGKTDRDKEGERAATSERKISVWLDLLVDQTRLKTDVSVLTFIPVYSRLKKPINFKHCLQQNKNN
jgi:hypothetical protein